MADDASRIFVAYGRTPTGQSPVRFALQNQLRDNFFCTLINHRSKIGSYMSMSVGVFPLRSSHVYRSRNVTAGFTRSIREPGPTKGWQFAEHNLLEKRFASCNTTPHVVLASS